MQRSLQVVVLTGIAGIALMAASCGQSESTSDTATQEPTHERVADTADSVDTAMTGRTESSGAGADCSAFSEDLLNKFGLQKQLVLNLAMTEGRNLQTMRETTGAPEPETFRTLGAAFEAGDWGGIESMEAFDTPDLIARDLGKTATLLENALAAESGAAAWKDLSAFYTQKFFVRHNSSISYYLNEAGCL